MSFTSVRRVGGSGVGKGGEMRRGWCWGSICISTVRDYWKFISL